MSLIAQQIQYCSSDFNWKQNILFCHIRVNFSLDFSCFEITFVCLFLFQTLPIISLSVFKNEKYQAVLLNACFKNTFQLTYYLRLSTCIFKNTFWVLIWITGIYVSQFDFWLPFLWYIHSVWLIPVHCHFCFLFSVENYINMTKVH